MDRRVKDGLRAGATAVGVAAGLMALASTAQTPDGFIRASFGGPLDVFRGTDTSDVLSIGDGAGDATELAALLKGSSTPTGTAAVPDSPYRAAFEAGSTPGATTLNVFPTTDPVTGLSPFAAPDVKATAIPPSKPVVDSQGRVDCTGAVSCDTNPVTKVTTVVYPDGVVAIVQKVNDLTVVAYKTLTEALPPSVQALLPAASAPEVAATAPAPPPTTSPDPTQEPAVETATAPEPPAPDTATPPVDPATPAPEVVPDPEVDLTDADPGPRADVTPPPIDFSPDSPLGDLPTPNLPKPKLPDLGKVKDALGSVVDGVSDAVGKATDAVGKAIGSGASGKADSSGSQDTGGDSGKNDSGKNEAGTP